MVKRFPLVFNICGGSLCVSTQVDYIKLHLATALPISPLCIHLKSLGELKAAVNQVKQLCHDYTYVIRTEVKAYYASIDYRLTIYQMSSN